MDNSTLLNNTCEASRLILTSSYVQILMGEVIVAILAIPPNLLFLCIIPRVSIFCPDLRLLLAHFSFVLFWFSLGDLVKCVHILSSFECGYPMRVRMCKLFDTLCVGLPARSLIFSFLALCFHQAYANVRYKTYDKTSLNAHMSIFLIVVSWIVSCWMKFFDFPTLPMNEFVPICVTSMVPVQWWWNLHADTICELMATIVVICIFLYTKYVAKHMSINRALYDLSSRFQVDQNMRVNAILMPSMILHIVCHIPSLVLQSGLFGLWDMESDTRPWLSRLSILWRLLYAFAHPILAFYLNADLKKRLMRISYFHTVWRVLKKSKVDPITVLEGAKQTTHFNYLDQIWSKTKPKQVAIKKF